VLEQDKPNDEARLDPRPALVAVERCDLAIDPAPIDLAYKLHQFVLQVDDLVEPRPEQIALTCRLRLLRSHRSLPRNATTESCHAIRRNPENEIASFRGCKPRKLAIIQPPNPPKIDSCSTAYVVLHGRRVGFGFVFIRSGQRAEAL